MVSSTRDVEHKVKLIATGAIGGELCLKARQGFERSVTRLN